MGRLTGLGPLQEAARIGSRDPDKLLVAAYRRLGPGVLDLLEGEFAVALWDAEGRRGLLARDRIGLRSLFLCADGPTLHFAEEIRPLLELLGRRRGVDRVAVAHWLARTGIPDGRTLYEGVERLGPGQVILLGQDGWSRRRWWRPHFATPRFRESRDAERHLAAGMESAVARSVGGRQVPAVMLSGGFDSGSIAALANRHRRMPTYSTVFPDLADVDESAAIRRLREELGLDGVEMAFSGGSAIAPSLAFLVEHEVPSLSPNALVWRPLAQRAAQDGIEVLVDGEGGDELLGCVPYLIADALRGGRPVKAWRLARELPGAGVRPPARWMRRALTLYGLRGALPARTHAWLRARRARTPSPAWLLPDLARLHQQTHDPWGWKRSGGPAWQAWLTDAVIRRPDAMGTAEQQRREAALAGLEPRHPYRDHRLLDTVLDIDPQLMFDAHRDRPLARRAVAPMFPAGLSPGEHKPAFNAVLEGALAGPDAGAVARLLADPRPEVSAFVDLDLFAATLSGPGRGSRSGPLAAWRILTLEHWLQFQSDPDGFRDRTSADVPNSA